MLWPVVLPAEITFWTLVGLVLVATLAARTKRGAAFALASLLAVFAFVPSCIGIQAIVDARRFGTFEYDDYSRVQDFRVERYLPPAAEKITLKKHPQGYVAKYEISESELAAYLDGLWERYGHLSASTRDQLDDGTTVSYESFALSFQAVDWPPLKSATSYHSPVESDGGGASYYFDVESGVVYQHAGYW
ncbi:MAG: hypothetical protein KDA37_00525 [Planctomycetales bacterium]|nr:hypothetical protein [Planctomycetales bacterium]